VFLVIQRQAEQRVVMVGEVSDRADEPGAEAVCVHGDAQVCIAGAERLAGQCRQLTMQFRFQYRDQFCVAAEPGADFGGDARASAHDERSPDSLFEEPQALRDCRGRDVQQARRAFEAALTGHGGEGREQRLIQHRIAPRATLVKLNQD